MADHPPRNSATPRVAASPPDPRAASRQKLVVVLLAGILLVAFGILIVLLLGLPGRLAPTPRTMESPVARQTPPIPTPTNTTPSTPAPSPVPNAAVSSDPSAENSVTHSATEAPATPGTFSRAGRAERSLPRSPIPEPGEVITKPILAAKVADAESPDIPRPAPPTTDVVPWNQAAKHVGQEITVEGKIVSTRRSGSVCFLNFSRDRDAFYLILFKKTLGGWPAAPETYFKNKTVRAKGKVELHNDRPQIQIEDASQLVVVE